MDAEREALLAAVQVEVEKVADGMMSAMAVLGMLIYASGNITKQEFLGIAGKAAARARQSGNAGNAYAGALLEGMVRRICESEGDPPGARDRKSQ